MAGFDWAKSIQQSSANRGVANLQLQLAAQRAKAQAQGLPAPHPNSPSILSRIFDVVSRPNYAVANAFGNVIDKVKQNQAAGKGGNPLELPGLLASGALQGLEGKAKTRFSDVYGKGQDQIPILKNRVVRGLGGFATDIALDPLNFAGPGIEKAVPAVESLGAAGQGIKAAQKAGATVEGLTGAGEAAATAAKAAQPGRLTLEVLGRPIGGELGAKIGEAAYEGIGKVGRPLLATGPVSSVRNALSTAVQYPGKLHEFWRTSRLGGTAGYRDLSNHVIDTIGGLSKTDGSLVSHALEEHGSMAPKVLAGQVSHKGVDLGEAAQFWLDHKNAMDQVEQKLGIYRTGQNVDNYIPHKFPKVSEYNSEEAQNFRNIAKNSIKAGKSDPGALPTLTDLKDTGLHPHENIVDVMRLRAADHFRMVAKADFQKRALNEFGISIGGKGAKAAEQAARDLGHVPINSRSAEIIGHPDVLGGAERVMVPQQVKRSIDSLNDFYKSEESSMKLMKTFDSAQRMWKAGVTTMNPGHHLRQMVGDTILNYEAGVRNPLDYERAMKVLKGTGSIKIGDRMVDAEELHNLYKLHGGASGFFNTELVGSGSAIGSKFENPANIANKGLETLRNITAKREDYMRLANFTHAMREEGSKLGHVSASDLDEIAKKATARVRKFNFDFGDVTRMETNIRRAVPFYTFMRKNLPLQMEMLALHPNKIANIPKGFNAVSQLLGTDPQHMPLGEVVPQYLRDMDAVRLRGETKGHNAIYAGLPDNPIEQISQLFSGSTSDVMRKLVGQLTPAVRMPAEVGFKESSLSGAPLRGGEGGYLMDQFGLSRTLRQQIAGPGKPHSVVTPGSKPPNSAFNIANYLTGMGVKEVTPQAELAEIKRQQAPVKASLKQARIDRINKALRGGK